MPEAVGALQGVVVGLSESATYLTTFVPAFSSALGAEPVIPPPPILYWMRGRDNGESGVVYRLWQVANAPDPTGASYSGPLTGALVDIVTQSFSPAKPA